MDPPGDKGIAMDNHFAVWSLLLVQNPQMSSQGKKKICAMFLSPLAMQLQFHLLSRQNDLECMGRNGLIQNGWHYQIE